MSGPNKFSRYRFSTAQTDAEGRLFLTDRTPFRFRELADNRRHVVREGDTLFGLAGRFFAPMPRGSGLWWIIADYNGTHDPTIPPVPGTVLVIPSIRTVQEQIFNERRRRNE